MSNRSAFPCSQPAEQRLVTASEGENRYPWLFRKDETSHRPSADANLFVQLEQHIKHARKLYLSGEVENALLKYRTALDHLQALINDAPPGDPLLWELDQHFSVFSELATRLLGPVENEPPADLAPNVFHLMERRRICLRSLIMKKAGPLRFFDVPDRLLEEEAHILRRIMEIRREGARANSFKQQAELKERLGQVRKALKQSSERYARLRQEVPPSLARVRRELLQEDEVLIDLTLLHDRLVAGIITREQATYHQVPMDPGDIASAVFNLQDKLREATMGSKSTFMGHAWKEPCRRVYRSVFGRLPRIPDKKGTVLIIPDQALWYLPFSALLDMEDRPLGQEYLVSTIPSADMLAFVRSRKGSLSKAAPSLELLLFESVPWISEEELGRSREQRARHDAVSEGERIELLILTNPVYPRPSRATSQLQRTTENSAAWVGPTATTDRFLAYRKTGADTAVLAVPCAMTDRIEEDREPSLFFSPDKRGRRRFTLRNWCRYPVATNLAAFPVAWFDAGEHSEPRGEGPILFAMSTFYGLTPLSLINYSNPDWGADEPFLVSVCTSMAAGTAPGTALAAYPKKMPAGLDSSFSGKPPSWSGWILVGDPRATAPTAAAPAQTNKGALADPHSSR